MGGSGRDGRKWKGYKEVEGIQGIGRDIRKWNGYKEVKGI